MIKINHLARHVIQLWTSRQPHLFSKLSNQMCSKFSFSPWWHKRPKGFLLIEYPIFNHFLLLEPKNSLETEFYTDIFSKHRLYFTLLREVCQYSEFFWSVFSRIRTEYAVLRSCFCIQTSGRLLCSISPW